MPVTTESKITLRPSTSDDIEWLDAFYERLMRPYVELTHTWDSKKFREVYAHVLPEIIQLDGEDIGMFMTEVTDQFIYLRDIHIEPSHQGRGIGSYFLNKVIEQSSVLNLPIRLKVLKGNPTRGLYQRFGFRVIEEMEHCFVMERTVGACCSA